MTIDCAENQMAMQRLMRAVLLCLAASMLGCNNRGATVNGNVRLDGEPLTLGTVTFHPLGEGRSGYGSIAPDGSYSIHAGNGDGIPAGRYAVTVVALEPPTPSNSPFGMPTPGKHITPPRYASRSTSELTAQVQAGPNRLDLELSGE
jgi:hypothetical protein